PIPPPSARPSGTGSPSSTVTSWPRVRQVAATSLPMNPAPTTTTPPGPASSAARVAPPSSPAARGEGPGGAPPPHGAPPPPGAGGGAPPPHPPVQRQGVEPAVGRHDQGGPLGRPRACQDLLGQRRGGGGGGGGRAPGRAWRG